MNTNRESLGAAFAEAIDGSGYTKSELAREVGVSPQSVNNWLARGVPPRYAFQIARLLNTTPSAISGIVEKETLASISPYNDRLVIVPMFTESGEGVIDYVVDVGSLTGEMGGKATRTAIADANFVAVVAESGAMAPEISEGDIAVADTARHPRPGDVALAKEPSGRYLIRRYSEVDTDGTFRLTPASDDWPVITADESSGSIELLGTVVALRKLYPVAREYR